VAISFALRRTRLGGAVTENDPDDGRLVDALTVELERARVDVADGGSGGERLLKDARLVVGGGY